MILLRAYLLAGLVGHKLLWEWLKRGSPSQVQRRPPAGIRVRLVKLVKLAILAGIIFQTVFPGYWVRILDEPGGLVGSGVVIYTLGLALALVGRLQLGRNWSDIETAQVLPRQAVVRRGVYNYIRHPIYVGDLLLLAGLELALNSWLTLGVLVLAPVVLARAVREEELLKRDLPGYREYCESTKRFIPFVV